MDLQIDTHCEGKNPSAWDYVSMNDWLSTMNVSVRIKEEDFPRSNDVREKAK